MELYDPTVLIAGEEHMDTYEAEDSVDYACRAAQAELKVLRTMVDNMPDFKKGGDLDSVARKVYRGMKHLKKRIDTSHEVMTRESKRFYYHVKRRRTKNRINRLRWWRNEHRQLVRIKELREGGDSAKELKDYYICIEDRTVKQFKLQAEMREASRREAEAERLRDEDSDASSCETSENDD